MIADNKPTTEASVTHGDEVVQFFWRTPKIGDAGIVLGGTPNNPLKRKDLFFVVLDIQPSHHRFANVEAVCLVTNASTTTKETLGIDYFITADKPVPRLFSKDGLDQLKNLVGDYSRRYLIDSKIIT